MSVVGLIVYFIPTIWAAFTSHSSLKGLFITNLLVGWTGIGWLICLLWALVD